MSGLRKSRPRTIVALGAALWVLASTAYGAPVPLSNGVPVTGLSGTIGSESFYTIVVPAGQDDLEIKISGGTGDCDLYVRRGLPPTTLTYDYRPYQVGNNETVAVASPAAGTWYVMLRGYTAYAGLTLVATYSASVSVTPLANGVPVSGLSGATGSERFYQIVVPAGQTKLEIQISGGTGDCDLYVKRDSLPTVAVYDYRPYLVGNNEKVTVDSPAAGTWYLMLRGYSAYTGVTLVATSSGGVGIVLTNGVPVTGLSGAASSEKLYRIDVPAGQTNLEIKISGGNGDCDLYVKYGAPATVSNYDYRPFTPGNDETVSVNDPTAGSWYLLLRGYSAYTGVTLLASYGNVQSLTDGVAVPGLSGTLGSETLYKIDVPSGETTLEVKISGGTGNCDLYVRRGLPPTVSSWDYRPYLPGNDETVTIDNPQSGSWYILLRARQAYAGVTLLADHWFVGSVTLLSNGVPVTNLSGAQGSQKYYRLIVPSGQTQLEFQISGGTGDADLYVKRDATPTLTEYDYRPYLIGNDETVTIANPTGGNWLIMVHGYQAYTGMTLVATYQADGGGGEPTVTPLTNGVPVTGLAGAASDQAFFQIDVPAGQSQLEIQMSGGTGDADLHVRKDLLPTLTEWDYRPYLIGNEETVTINTPAAGTYYLLLNAYQAYSGVTLVATYVPLAEPVIELSNGVPVAGLSGATGSEAFYKIVVPAGQDFLDIQIAGGTGDCDLHVKKGAKPTTSSWDYRPYLIGNNETVHIDDPAAATWYILLHGYQAYAGMTLVATYGVTAVGNNFAVDPNCVALWRFESKALHVDSIGSNTLSKIGVPDANTVDYQEGAASVDMNTNGVLGYLDIVDANLSPDFPLKSGTTNTKLSVAFWMKARTGSEQVAGGAILYGKGEANKHSFTVGIYEPAGPGTATIRIGVGLADGSNAYYYTPSPKIIERDTWYHIAVTYAEGPSDGTVKLYIYDTATASSTNVTATTRNAPLLDGRLALGGYRWSSHRYDGLLDEMVVFNDVLTAAEITKIRQGTYGKP
jgi:hypothetical protein